MNTTKTIYNKLFSEDKVELESHKVDLATVAELLKEYINAVKVEKESADAYLVLKTDVARARQKIQDNSLVSERLLTQYITFEKNAKALGLNLPQDIKANQDTIKKTATNYSRYIKNINSIKL